MALGAELWILFLVVIPAGYIRALSPPSDVTIKHVDAITTWNDTPAPRPPGVHKREVILH